MSEPAAEPSTTAPAAETPAVEAPAAEAPAAEAPATEAPATEAPAAEAASAEAPATETKADAAPEAPAAPPAEKRERKSRWDAPAANNGEASSAAAPAVSQTDVNEAAAKAAEIAAKIAASLAPPGSTGQEVVMRAKKIEGDYTKDIEINDLRNRYVLTRGNTQKQIEDETGCSIETKGVWVPDRSRMPPGEMPLYLHIVAKTQVVLDAAVREVQKLIDEDLGPLIEERTLIARARARGEAPPPGLTGRPKWPEAKLFIELEPIRNFNIRAKIVGPGGMFVKYIQAETGARVQIKGRGSGFLENDTGRESDEKMHISIVAPTDDQIGRARVLAEDLLLILNTEYDKARGVTGGYDSYAQSGVTDPYAGYGGAAAAGGAAGGAAPAGGAAAGGDDQWAQYLAYYQSMGYDVNDPQFIEWLKTQQAQQAAGGAPAAA